LHQEAEGVLEISAARSTVHDRRPSRADDVQTQIRKFLGLTRRAGEKGNCDA